MAGNQERFEIERVGFRNGTDAELTALHTVESEVEAERRPEIAPQPVESYIAFARSLPSQFDDHTWVARDERGEPVAAAACWSNSSGDRTAMECDIWVREPWRRQGLGTQLWETIVATTRDDDRSLLVWQTFDTVPAGDAFSAIVGGEAVLVNRRSRLALDEVDWSLVRTWIDEGPVRASGYSLEAVDGTYPEHLRADAATVHHFLQTAPQDDLASGPVMLTVDDVIEQDRALIEAGRERWTIFVRDPSGTCVGGTDVEFEPWDPPTVMQHNTAVDPDHRGLGLGKWVKAAMLDRIRRECPDARQVITTNAFSNGPMLAINDALGFEVIRKQTTWQRRLDPPQLPVVTDIVVT